MKKIFTLLVLFLGLTAAATAQVNKTLVKSIAVKNSLVETTAATVTLPGKVEVTEWDNNVIRITTYLTVENMGENIVKQLVVVGRYAIESEVENGKLVIIMPKMAHQITVKGVQLSEVLRFEVSTPKGYQIMVKGDTKVAAEAHNDLGQNL
jgi:hypothetical protein